ncbi:PREDICTED: olfactory receptor 14J1-like [Elephantulus edwardii]|uniref:olfactory receptor 14J1-like n=1 Tax=Elephantulus edwardii TaxID=28737 RepID=UPI0003F0A0D0|nr:PREDICTED: olfactory receptor 14J1-like [Elephantulus edwardii]
MANNTMSGFLLVGFSEIRELQILHAFLFLVMYLLSLAGNFIIIIITTLDHQLQSPMYYFLKHLSLLDLSVISVTVPQSITNSLLDDGSISYSQCVLQVFFFTALAGAEVSILTVMSYDRYIAICSPLHYEIVMNPSKCKWAVMAVWLSGGISGTLYTSATFSIVFCRARIIHQFFCDVPQLLKLTCCNDYLRVIGVAAFMSLMACFCFTFIVFSYIHIFSTVLRIPSAEGQSKAFSTCLPHLFVVTIFVTTGICEFLKPATESPTVFDLAISIFYTVIPPSLNPIIYSLRNDALKEAFRKLLLGEEYIRRK